MASVREIARQVGVSPATVSRAINNPPRVAQALRDKILAAMNESRYVPQVGRRSTSNIAFAYTGDSSLGSPFDAALMQGMSDRMEVLNFDLMILDVPRAKLPEENYTQMFLRKGVRGAVLRTTARSRNVCEQIVAEGFPALVVGEYFDAPTVSYICSESRQTSREAVGHLIALGHKRIAISINVVDDSDHIDRLDGYRDAMKAAGLEHDERLILRAPARRDGGVQLIRRLWSMPDRPTALYISDPMVAVGAMNESQAMGIKVPDDLSIVGFDDAEMRFIVYPQMTAVCQDAAEIGREAFDALQGMIDGAGSRAPVQKVLPTRFEIHGSTAPPTNGAIRANKQT